MRGCSRLQVKYELYQAFGKSPKTRIRCSAEVSMAFDRYTTRRTGTICQPEKQVKDGSAWSCIINIWDGSSWRRCSMRTCGVNARRSVGVWTGSKTRIRRQCTVSGNSLNWRVFWYYGGTNLHRQKVRRESFRGFARKEQILTDCRFK